jgi:hypothetical protein
VTFAAVVLDWPAASWAALVAFPRSRGVRAGSRRPGRETRSLTLACLPAAIGAHDAAAPTTATRITRQNRRVRELSMGLPCGKSERTARGLTANLLAENRRSAGG